MSARVERSLENAPRLDSVRDVDDLDLRRDALDNAVAGTDEVVLETEVGQKGDEAKTHGLLHCRRFGSQDQSPVEINELPGLSR